MELLHEAGVPAARSAWFDLNGYRFLELERFDRVGLRGRRGVISLEAIKAHFLDPVHDGWSGAGSRILQEPSLAMEGVHAERMVWLDTFGELIGLVPPPW